MQPPTRFGAVLIGDEILCGKRKDKHLPHVIDALQMRGLKLAWAKFLGDDLKHLVHALSQTQQDDIPVFCFGGIGATPDDQTRHAAAEAFGTSLLRHKEALAMIESRFGESAYPNRVLMADLPEDCLLIPNSYNQIPGFTLYEHHFFPGFPNMAWQMFEWVLDHYYSSRVPQQTEHSLRVLNVRESDLIPLMESLTRHHPRAKLFSLPHIDAIATIEIGFRGEPGPVEAAFRQLVCLLKEHAYHFTLLDQNAY